MFHLNKMIQELKSIDDKYKLWNKKKKLLTIIYPWKMPTHSLLSPGWFRGQNYSKACDYYSILPKISINYRTSMSHESMYSHWMCHTFLPMDSSFRSIIKSVFILYFFSRNTSFSVLFVLILYFLENYILVVSWLWPCCFWWKTSFA